MIRALFLALIFAGSAHAQMAMLGAGAGAAQPYTPYAGPGDTVAFTAWYSCAFGYSKAVADPGTTLGCRVRRATDSATLDLNVLHNGTVDVSSAISFAGVDVSGTGSISGTTLTITGGATGDTLAPPATPGTYIVSGSSPTWTVNISQTVASTTLTLINKLTISREYDQTGGGRMLVGSGTATEPTFVPGLIGTAPGIVFTSGSINLASSGSFTPTSATASFSVVANRFSGTAVEVFLRENGQNNRVGGQSATANHWALIGGTSGTLAAVANDGVPHAGNIVLSGASSVLNIDGSETTGTATGNTTAGTITMTGGTAVTNYIGEGGFIDNVAITSGNRTSLNSNQHTRYGF